MAVTEEMLTIACDTKPHFCCPVPEKRQEVTTEGGLDVAGQRDKMRDACKRRRTRVSGFCSLTLMRSRSKRRLTWARRILKFTPAATPMPKRCRAG